MDLKIFDVEHGACSLLTCDNKARFMIDCGHNGTSGWYPGRYLRAQNIFTLEALAITNFDEDHVSGFPDLIDRVHVQWLYRNQSISSSIIRTLKREDGMGAGIERLSHAMDNVFTSNAQWTLPPVLQGLTWSGFCNFYPFFDDENNLSLVIHLHCHGIGILFPGDLEWSGWLNLLERADFKETLRNTHVLVASHHGRENGCCEEIFEFCKPFYVVISDKGYMYDTQETIPFYRQFARGGPFRGETRHVLTTRKDGRIGFSFAPGNWGPY